MRKPDKAVLQQTAHVALGVAILVALMLGVYAIVGALSLSAVLGGVYTGALGVANFFIMGLMVQGITERAAEKERDEEELAALTLEMNNRMKLSYNARMIALFALLVLGIAVFHFDALACIIAAIFPSVVIRVLQIMEAKKAPVSEGSEKL